ncbi:aKG-HExxH-type peptide beta-hydroxylase [Planobispora takensis]|uniref:HEXXH motif domain-containing protein n=1 Tax=Planobispora takensis TaxID=1367882 RepID=A0A8J3T285_9ACTN|nr:HEXXH motif-containing putative peptide modification protein [Planobispora takensis]GII03921.1 HEXXH motif domain-containing protein [Planobispora takensis]
MKLLPYRVSEEVFTELAAGGGGTGAVGELRALQRARRRLLVRGVVEEARAAGHAHAGLAARAYDLLAELESADADAVDAVLRHPAVGAWAWRTYRALTGEGAAGTVVAGSGGPGAGAATDPGRPQAGAAAGSGRLETGAAAGSAGPEVAAADPGRLGALAVAAAVRARVACEVRLPVRGSAIMLPSLGRAVLRHDPGEVADLAVRPDGTGAELRAGRCAVRIDRGGDAPGWQALHRFPVADGFSPILDDLDEYRWADHDVEPRLSAGRRRTWQACLDGAWRIMTADHRTVAEEVAAAVSVLTPIRPPAFGQNSASGREIFGTVALSEPRHGLGLAATFAHEIQHAKLTALIDEVDLTLPDDGRRYYAPWRPDPRPAYGLLQGAYAFMGVADFWRRRRGLERGAAAFRAQVELVRWREGAHLVIGTLLDSGGLTGRGEEFVTGMRRTVERLLAEPVDLDAAAQAHREAGWHRAAWNRRNAGATGR